MAPQVDPIPIPDGSFMAAYRDTPYCQADAWGVVCPVPVDLPVFIAAFFDTPLFRVERWVLKVFAGRATSRADVTALANGHSTRFAMWQVADRSQTEIMLAVDRSRIRTWLAIHPSEFANGSTVLYFGSAVLPKPARPDGKADIGFGFRALTGFHNLYSRLLLTAALAKLARQS